MVSSILKATHRRNLREAKAAYLLQKLKETKPLSFSDKQSQKPSSGEIYGQMLRGGDDDASNMNGGTVGADMMILMKAESRTPAYHI
jgi:hypothetical protein